MININFYAQCFDIKNKAFIEMMQICFTASIMPDYIGTELHHIMPVGYYVYIASQNSNMSGINIRELNKTFRRSPGHECNSSENLVKLTHEDHMKVHRLAAECLRDDIEGKFRIYVEECKCSSTVNIPETSNEGPIFSIYYRGKTAGKFIFHEDESVTLLAGSKFAYDHPFSDFTRARHENWMKLKEEVAPNGILTKNIDVSGRRNAYIYVTNSEPSPDYMMMDDGTTMREYLKRKNN